MNIMEILSISKDTYKKYEEYVKNWSETPRSQVLESYTKENSRKLLSDDDG